MILIFVKIDRDLSADNPRHIQHLVELAAYRYTSVTRPSRSISMFYICCWYIQNSGREFKGGVLGVRRRRLVTYDSSQDLRVK